MGNLCCPRRKNSEAKDDFPPKDATQAKHNFASNGCNCSEDLEVGSSLAEDLPRLGLGKQKSLGDKLQGEDVASSTKERSQELCPEPIEDVWTVGAIPDHSDSRVTPTLHCDMKATPESRPESSDHEDLNLYSSLVGTKPHGAGGADTPLPLTPLGYHQSSKAEPEKPATAASPVLHGSGTASPSQVSKMAGLGRYAAAYRELQKIQKSVGEVRPCEFLDAATIERVKRIGAKCDAGMQMLAMNPEDLRIHEENKELQIRWGMTLEGGFIKVITVVDYDVDFLKGVLLDLEGDLDEHVSEDDVTAELLSKPHPHDASWRERTVKPPPIRTKCDDVHMVSSVDALDEALNAVCCFKYSLDPSATADPYGTQIPPPDDGYQRSPHVAQYSASIPLSLHGEKMRGMRKIIFFEWSVPPCCANNCECVAKLCDTEAVPRGYRG